jgi:S-adenosylmethionine synthetase
MSSLTLTPGLAQVHATASRAAARTSLLTSESVSEGHPDKVCDTISDAILDACLTQDPGSRVACETLAKSGQVVIAGEITTTATVDVEAVARQAIREIGYTHSEDVFHADRVRVTNLLTKQSPEIGGAVTRDGRLLDRGAGDQGIMFGYATDETPELMPLPILLAHRLARELAAARRSGLAPWLRPDAKTQVTVEYAGAEPLRVTGVLVSTQHDKDVDQTIIHELVRCFLLRNALGDWFTRDLTLLVNPSGTFVQGGPSADCGLTGRKVIVDTYGGAARHGGGAFSGKDPSKVDRSGAYYCRYVTREIIKAGLARRVELQAAYAIGRAEPVSIQVDTFGTGDAADAEAFVRERFDFRPGAIIEKLDLLRPIYRGTTNYGHFGKAGLPWEA